MKKDEKYRQEAQTPSDAPASKQRSMGQRAFDMVLYPGVTQFGVFGISCVATYLTNRGGIRNADGTLMYGKVGEFFQKRGDVSEKWLRSLGLGQQSAEMAKMVGWSFLDGSLLAPVIKLFEDKREDIARSVDRSFGNGELPDAHYQSEPKQSWTSVLGGRAITAGIVVPTAVALDKTGLNDVLFNNPGEKFGEFVAKNKGIRKWFGSVPPAEAGRIATFEFFYTGVCTAGLYYISRAIARMQEDARNQTAQTIVENDAPALTQEIDETPSKDVDTRTAQHIAPTEPHAQLV